MLILTILKIARRMRMEALFQVCDSHLFKYINLSSTTPPREYIKLLKDMAVPLDEMFFACLWRYDFMDCSKLYTEVITEEGICYTFNMLDGQELFKTDVIDSDFESWNHNSSSTNWTLEKGYETNSITLRFIKHLHIFKNLLLEPDTYPKRILSTGVKAGLVAVFLLKKKNFDYICRGPVQGFKIILHTPGDIPRTSKQFFRAPINQDVILSVKPQMMITDKELDDYAPERL